ncbi:P-loop containing nucleoside triphosphate hydrolase protein [Chytriomyces sp. MP71]|nr:P-loop containing nucleoside triphosphate hydrolase protein [Chytriomyces sp. MP71]
MSSTHVHVPSEVALAPATASTVTSIANSLTSLSAWFLKKPLFLTDEALLLSHFGYHEQDIASVVAVFGPQDQVQITISAIVRAINAAPFTELGRLLAAKELEHAAAARNSVIDYVLQNPDITEVPIDAPLIVLGLPGTGSHLLHNLLACDPNARAFRLFEVNPELGEKLIPPPSEDEYATHSNVDHCREILERTDTLFPGYLSGLLQGELDLADADCILQHQGLPPSHIPHAAASLRAQTLLADWEPFDHVVLHGGAAHLAQLHALLSVFPDARVVVVNRALEEVVPATTRRLARLCGTKVQPNAVHRHEFGKEVLEDVVGVMKDARDFRLRIGANFVRPLRNAGLQEEWKGYAFHPAQVMDVSYEQLVKDPVGAVRKIYAHFEVGYSDEFEEAMEVYLEGNPTKALAEDLSEVKEMFGFTDEGIVKANEDATLREE